jgi:hypothetical protein
MELNKRKKSSKVVKVDSFYARIAEKGRINRENDDMEDLCIEDWISYIKRFKEDERRREEAERL